MWTVLLNEFIMMILIAFKRVKEVIADNNSMSGDCEEKQIAYELGGWPLIASIGVVSSMNTNKYKG